MSFADVRHQSRAQRLIQRALAGDRLPHAYIFHGPEGVGRELFARTLARRLLCEAPMQDSPDPSDRPEGLENWTDPIADSCGRCRSCVAIDADSHPDLHLIHRQLIKQHPDAVVRARKGFDLGIDVIREYVVNRAYSKPALQRGKVFIIREAEKMNPAAQNALLKTLEEPPPATFLILLADSESALLPTVRSRCQPIPFVLLPREFVQQRLASLPDAQRMTPADLDWISAFAAGSLGQAIQYVSDGLGASRAWVVQSLTDLTRVGPSQTAARWLESSLKMGAAYQRREPDISDTDARRRGLHTLLAIVTDLLRVRLAASCAATEHTSDHQAVPLFETWSAHDAARAITQVAETERHLDLNANAQLCIETLLIELLRRSRSAVG